MRLRLAVLLLLAPPAFATSVAPAGNVKKSTAIWSAPAKPNAKVGQLRRGQRLPLVSSRAGWYEVRLESGASGWVRKQFADEVADPAAGVPAQLSHRAAPSAADVPTGPPAARAFRVHLIDVGTGLAVLVQGHDFTLLFDGGSKDDKAGIAQGKSGNRLLAYLAAALGPSGGPECSEAGQASAGQQEVTIDHLVLSHPHDDHGNLLDDVVRCYRVKNVWDSGRINDTAFYREFLQAVAAEGGVVYRTAAAPTPDRRLTVGGTNILVAPSAASWQRFEDLETLTLGDAATLTVLHADAESHADPNGNSLVLRLDLGPTSVLLTGDAESGPRLSPSAAAGDVEQELLQLAPNLLDVDILQVGHHGSLTSSRKAFLDAVSPKWALIGSGPYRYKGVKLPDAEVPAALKAAGATVLRTDATDGAECPAADRVGRDDARPGGCDNHILELAAP